MESKERIDKIISEKYNISRTLAQKYITSGIAYISIPIKELIDDEDNIVKIFRRPNQKVSTKYIDHIYIREEENKYKFVSQGALKLEKALEEFNINIENKIALDMGASTGGFSEVLLLKNAKKVYAIDVGTNQISPKLTKWKNLYIYENTDIRDVYKIPEIKDEKIDIVVGDLSFISLKLVYDTIIKMSPNELVLLIKPQFEIGKEISKTKGIVKDEKLIKKAILDVLTTYLQKYDLKGITYSPLISPKTNIEYLVYLKLNEEEIRDIDKIINIIEKENIEKKINRIVTKSINKKQEAKEIAKQKERVENIDEDIDEYNFINDNTEQNMK